MSSFTKKIAKNPWLFEAGQPYIKKVKFNLKLVNVLINAQIVAEDVHQERLMCLCE